LVMAQIKVGFGTIVSNEHLTMLVRRHSAGIDIQIRVEFTDTHAVTTCLKECSQSCGSYAFSKGRNHAASDEYISRHGLISLDFLDWFPHKKMHPGGVFSPEPGGNRRCTKKNRSQKPRSEYACTL